MSYNYYPARRRYIDRCAYMVRHNDGLQEIGKAIDDKCKKFIQMFKALPTGRKIAYILGRILQLVSAAFSISNGAEAVKIGKELLRNKKEVEKEVADSMRLMNTEGYSEEGLQGMRGRLEGLEWRRNARGVGQVLGKVSLISGSFNVLMGLVGVFAGSLIKSYAVSK